jgi:hypothetical protein
VDESTVRVEIWWRGGPPEEEILEGLPPRIETRDLTYVERDDGGVTLVPRALVKEMRRLRFADGSTPYEQALVEPEEYLEPAVPADVAAAQEYAERLLRAHVPDFDARPARERAERLTDTIEGVNKLGDARDVLGRYLTHAAGTPGKRVGKQPIKDPARCVFAAILRNVHGWGSIKIGERLGIEGSAERIEGKRENQNASQAANRGFEILERAFGGEEGWLREAARLRSLLGD